MTKLLELLTVSDVAKLEGVTTQMIHHWISDGTITKVHRFGVDKTKILIEKGYKITANRKKVKS